ncbi:MAG: hypothetical protein ACI4CT_00165 [Lachnospiraceae bacterium]
MKIYRKPEIDICHIISCDIITTSEVPAYAATVKDEAVGEVITGGESNVVDIDGWANLF